MWLKNRMPDRWRDKQDIQQNITTSALSEEDKSLIGKVYTILKPDDGSK
jgi:hypothetical protein